MMRMSGTKENGLRGYVDGLHARARKWPPFLRLAIISRILLAAAFMPTGLTKLLGNRFTTLGVETPIGYFFEAMYQTGFYWNFLGLSQVVAGILLLIPVTSTLGAVAFFPIVINITIVTWSINFQGTRYITVLMLLASIFLLCWDWDRLRSILFIPAERPAAVKPAPLPKIELAGYVLGVVSGLILLTALRGLIGTGIVRWMLGTTALATLMVLVGWIQANRKGEELSS